MNDTKSAAVYKRRQCLIVSPISRTITGVGIGTPPFEVLSEEVSLGVLGDAIARALESARSGLPHPGPNEWSIIAKPLYEAAGVKSWSAFVKGAIYCTVAKTGGCFVIEPSQNKGARGGFQPIIGQSSLTIPLESSVEDIGLAVREALSISEGSRP